MNRHVKAFLIIGIIALTGVWAFNVFYLSSLNEESEVVLNLEDLKTKGVPNFKITDLDGQSIELHSLEGKLIILNFWASWCTPCIEEIPSLVKLAKKYSDNLVILAVSGDSTQEDVQVFLKSFPDLKKQNIKIVWEQEHELMKQFKIAKLPESLIILPNKKLAKKIVGSIDWYTEESIEYINSLIAN